METPIISICMITYNHDKYIAQALDSVLMQEIAIKYEVIIGDDCSSDRTVDILREYENKYPEIIKPIYREKNIGATNNLYDVLLHAKGDYIAVLEGDDFWNDNKKLSTQFRFMENNNDYIGVVHGNNRCDAYGNLIEEYPFKIREGKITINDFFKFGFLYHTSTLFFKNIFLNRNQNYEKLLTSHPLVGDYPLAILLLDIGDMYLLNDKFSTYRKILKSGGTNAQSIAKSNLMKSMTQQLKQTLIINDFYNSKYNFDLRIRSQIAFLWLTFIPFFTNKNREDKREATKLLKTFDIKTKISAFVFYFIKLSEIFKKVTRWQK